MFAGSEIILDAFEYVGSVQEGKLDPAKEIKIPGIKTESELKRDAVS